MLAVGNEELGDKLDKTYSCQICGKEHEIIYGKTEQDGSWVENKILSFYKCGDKTYLAGIDGRKLMEKSDDTR